MGVIDPAVRFAGESAGQELFLASPATPTTLSLWSAQPCLTPNSRFPDDWDSTLFNIGIGNLGQGKKGGEPVGVLRLGRPKSWKLGPEVLQASPRTLFWSSID